MKKILFIHHSTGWGGAPKNMIEIINKLDKTKYDTEVLLLKDSIVAEKLEEYGIKYTVAESIFYKKHYRYFTHTAAGYVKWYQWHRLIKLSISWALSRYFYASKELSGKKIDIIHLNSSVLTDWLAPSQKIAKVIIHVQEPLRNGEYDLLYKFIKRQMRLYSDKIIAISQDNARRISIPEKTSVIYNYATAPEVSSPKDSYYSKKFLYMGGFAYIKGFYTMVEALNYLDDDIQIYFAGEYRSVTREKYLNKLIKKILGGDLKQEAALKKIKNHKKAIILGLLSNADIYFKESCCLISPFAVPHFARPVIEAFLYKKPVIASDVAGMDEIVSHNENGFLFKTNDAESLAHYINYLAKNPLKAKQMGENGYKIAKKTYSEKNISAFKAIYESL